MNPLFLIIADGTTFFAGLALVLISEGLLIRLRNFISRLILTVLAIIGVILLFISATPLPLWVYATWVIPAIFCLVLLNLASPPQRSVLVCFTILFVSTIGLWVVEAPYLRLPSLAVPNGSTIYVLGDSISAGTGTNERCWPTVLDEMLSCRVVNLAQAGATVDDAIFQAKGISDPRSLVIIEIGGNDMIGGTNATVFQTKLKSLLSSLSSNQHQVLLFELPLFPSQNAYGKAQRDAVRKYGAVMLPKRFFAKVLRTKNGTLDGLHLSQNGHNALARIVADVIHEK